MGRHPNCASACCNFISQVGCYPGWIMICSSDEAAWRRGAEPDMAFGIYCCCWSRFQSQGKFCLFTMFGVWPLSKNFFGEFCRLSSGRLIRGLQNCQRSREITSVLMSRVTYGILNGYMSNPHLKRKWWILPILPGCLFQCFTCCCFLMAKSFLVWFRPIACAGHLLSGPFLCSNIL